MTTQDLGRSTAAPGDDSSGALGTLFDSSPARSVQTSAAAVTGFVLGLLAILAVPFSLTMVLSGALAVVALVASVIGMARASRPDVAGGLLASLGLVLALATIALIGLRYAGLDTAFGDALVPTLADWLDSLNILLPDPVSEKFASVEDYLDSLAPDVRAAVEELRALLSTRWCPAPTDTISYNMPAVAGTAVGSCTTPGGRST